jgi:predicted HTH transcriptional regulator
MNNDYIFELIQNGQECEYLDFKATEYNKEQYENLLKDVMALANSDYEGEKYIIIGIKEREGKKEIIGLDKIKDSSSYQQLIHSNIEPYLNVEYFPITFEGKTLGVVRLHNNINIPYMMKKQYIKLNEGVCYIRKGSHQCLANRTDFDRFYDKKNTVIFKIPSSSERLLSREKNRVISQIKDGPIFKNVGNSMAYNVCVHLFLDIFITEQSFFLAGEVATNEEVSLSKLDDVILQWVEEIADLKTRMYAGHISHGCKMRLEFENERERNSFK